MSDLTPEQQERFLRARSLSLPEGIQQTLADLELAASGQGDVDLARLCADAATTIRSLHDELGTERTLDALEDRNYARARERALQDAGEERRMTDDDRDWLMGLSDDAIGQGGRLSDERQVELGRLALRAWAEIDRLRAQREDDRERVLLLIAEGKRLRTIVRGLAALDPLAALEHGALLCWACGVYTPAEGTPVRDGVELEASSDPVTWRHRDDTYAAHILTCPWWLAATPRLAGGVRRAARAQEPLSPPTCVTQPGSWRFVGRWRRGTRSGRGAVTQRRRWDPVGSIRLCTPVTWW